MEWKLEQQDVRLCHLADVLVRRVVHDWSAVYWSCSYYAISF